MKQLVLAGFNWTILTNIALLIFMGLFLGMVIWIFRKESTAIYEEAEKLPLKEEGDL